MIQTCQYSGVYDTENRGNLWIKFGDVFGCLEAPVRNECVYRDPKPILLFGWMEGKRGESCGWDEARTGWGLNNRNIIIKRSWEMDRRWLVRLSDDLCSTTCVYTKLFTNWNMFALCIIFATFTKALFVSLSTQTLKFLATASAPFVHATLHHCTHTLSRLPPHSIRLLPPELLDVCLRRDAVAIIGCTDGVVGTAISYALPDLSGEVDVGYSPAISVPPVIYISLVCAAFMGLSCNTTFQLIFTCN